MAHIDCVSICFHAALQTSTPRNIPRLSTGRITGLGGLVPTALSRCSAFVRATWLMSADIATLLTQSRLSQFMSVYMTSGYESLAVWRISVGFMIGDELYRNLDPRYVHIVPAYMSKHLQQLFVPIVSYRPFEVSTQRSLRFPACHHAIEMATAHFGVIFGCRSV